MAGQSDSNMSLFSPEEIEFMAEDEPVEIVPNLRMDSLNFICLAVALKKRGKCTIRPPQWMSIENLAQFLELERDSHAFQPLPFHYLEISRLLFDHAREDIPDMYMTNLEKFTASTVTWKNMSAMEVNIIRAFAGRALQAFYKHDNEQQATDTDRMLDKQPQIPTDRPKRNLKPR
ncbi:hypothetical protein POPTR_008G056200v4 [Populus trichocarpa]|uniref:Uncharacterized protein n=1 Tax=Populus trichocarpa TaxID=3694 RepID=A0ACC0SK08_POPTR|nr:hypothetical protein POPTR_008G056200v4 [Populus trichocarpa]